MKHTKGNWTAFASGDRFYVGSNSASFNNLLAEVYSPEESGDGEEEANAKLISAAPELLEALIKLKDEAWKNGVSSDYVYEVCKEAIKKATE